MLSLAGRDQTVACFASTDAEPDTLTFLAGLWQQGRAVLLPVLTGTREPMWAWCSGPGELRPGFRGIPEPTGTPLTARALGAAALVIVPALLATQRGDRLGTGGGWYDRALLHRAPDASVAAVLDGVDVVDTLPRDPWDLRVDLLVTEHGVTRTATE